MGINHMNRLFAVAAFSWLCMQQCVAATIVQSGSFSNRGSGVFQKFDAQLGYLDSVTIEQRLTGSAAARVEAFGSGVAVFRVSLFGTLGTEFGSIVLGKDSTRTASVPFNFIVSETQSGTALVEYSSHTTDLSRFIGSGSYIFRLNGPGPLLSVESVAGPTVTAQMVGLFEPMFDDFTITFDYHDPVPEPSVWMYLVTGFGLIGSLIRKQRGLSAKPNFKVLPI
jgi:hypothetical protein